MKNKKMQTKKCCQLHISFAFRMPKTEMEATQNPFKNFVHDFQNVYILISNKNRFYKYILYFKTNKINI